jgi:hypothetical protein
MNYDAHKIKEYHKKLLEENPNYNDELVAEFAENMPELYAKRIQYDYWGCHIYSEECYEEEIKKIKTMPKWTLSDIKQVAKVDFETKEYYLYDFAFLMNYYYNLYKHIFTDASYYVGIVKATLENPLMPKADDTAYHIAKKLR